MNGKTSHRGKCEPSMTKRERLLDNRHSITHKYCIGNPGQQYEGYIVVGLYEDGRPGELFIHAAKAGSITRGLLNGIGVLTSISLQSGVPIGDLVDKFTGDRFEPNGPTESSVVGECTSVLDYIFRWLGETFLKEDD